MDAVAQQAPPQAPHPLERLSSTIALANAARSRESRQNSRDQMAAWLAGDVQLQTSRAPSQQAEPPEEVAVTPQSEQAITLGGATAALKFSVRLLPISPIVNDSQR